ncbi:MAG: MaoC/PaaZ C-terminal domain-containing protein [Chloroflexota bacterium]
MTKLNVKSLEPGQALSPLAKEPVSKTQILRYAGASGDDNLIHTDVETARERGLDGVIAHGMLSMGILGQYLTDLAGPGNTRALRVRFAGMVRLGDVLTCYGTVRSIEARNDGARNVMLDLWIENQRGDRVTTGDAQIMLRP